VTGLKISPSILAADPTRLGEEITQIAGEADWVHVDVMDNHFVPNLSFGLPVVRALCATSPLPVDCHLNIDDPDRWAAQYAQAGAGVVTIHAEAARAPVRTMRAVRAAGARAGLALCPATPLEPYEGVLAEADVLLLLTIDPGFGGQSFLDFVLPKIRRAREVIDATGADVLLQVDGGITTETIVACAEIGVDVVVAGSAVFGEPDRAHAIRRLRAAAQAGKAAAGVLQETIA
jgi:ribulose-phosphate 3-epimerase